MRPATSRAAIVSVLTWLRPARRWLGLLIPVMLLTTAELRAADSVREKAQTVKEDVSRAAGRARDEVNRTVNETTRLLEEENPFRMSGNDLVAWLITGAAASYIAGLFLGSRSTGSRVALSLLAGFLGAYVAKVLVAAFQIQFHWGEIILRYETVFVSVVAACLLVLGGRMASALKKGSRPVARSK